MRGTDVTRKTCLGVNKYRFNVYIPDIQVNSCNRRYSRRELTVESSIWRFEDEMWWNQIKLRAVSLELVLERNK
jgi:hypothetical protein